MISVGLREQTYNQGKNRCWMSVCFGDKISNIYPRGEGAMAGNCLDDKEWRYMTVNLYARKQLPNLKVSSTVIQRDGKHCLFGFQSWVYSVLSVMVLSSKWGQKSVEDYILSAKITFFWLRSCFWPVCIFLPWSCDPVWSPDQKATCLPEPKGRSWQLQQGNPGLWSHQKYQVCGRIKYFPYTLKLGR